MFNSLAYVMQNPAFVLYLLQAMTYAAAAVLCRRAGHHSLTLCYAASSLLDGLLGACHLMHLG